MIFQICCIILQILETDDAGTRNEERCFNQAPLLISDQRRVQREKRAAQPSRVARAGSCVEYGDASHCTREYKRLFGAPPMDDVEQLREGPRARA